MYLYLENDLKKIYFVIVNQKMYTYLLEMNNDHYSWPALKWMIKYLN